MWLGRGAEGRLFRKEAMAVVGLSWILATVLGALPYMFSGTSRGPSMRYFEQEVFDQGNQVEPLVLLSRHRAYVWSGWKKSEGYSSDQYKVIDALCRASARGLSRKDLIATTGLENAPQIFTDLGRSDLDNYLIGPGEVANAPADRAANYRQRWVKMGLIDSMFESQSGFSTTGATVLNDLEDPHLVCLLYTSPSPRDRTRSRMPSSA